MANNDPRPLDNLQEDADEIKYHGYKLIKKIKRMKDPDSPDNPYIFTPEYAELLRNGKTIAKFEMRDVLDVTCQLNLFSLLGGQQKQFAISITRSRGGFHWVVSVEPTFKIIFDSYKWRVGNDEAYDEDIDGDGIEEIILDFALYGFTGAMAYSPHIPVIFKYDKRAREYLPANHILKDYSLRTLEKMKAHLSDSGASPTTYVVEITFAYIFAGQEKEGWDFFDREFPTADDHVVIDKKRTRKDIRDELNNSPFYKYIYRESRKQKS